MEIITKPKERKYKATLRRIESKDASQVWQTELGDIYWIVPTCLSQAARKAKVGVQGFVTLQSSPSSLLAHASLV